MGLFKRLRLATKLLGSITEEEAQMLAKVIPGGTKTSPYRGTQQMLTAYSRSPWVRAVIGKISDAIGSTKWALFAVKNPSGKFVKMSALQSKGIKVKDYSLGNIDLPDGYEVTPILDHPFLRLLNTANPLFPGSVGRSQTQISMELTGEAHWILDPEWQGGRAVPERFWLIPSTWVRAMPYEGEPYWDIKTPSWEGKLPTPAIFRFATPDPVNPYGRGSAHMRAFGDEIDTDEYAAQYTKNWFLNNARPDLLITSEGLSKPDTERLELSWLQQTQSFRRAHKPFFLPKKVDITTLSPKFSDMEMRPLRSWERDVLVHGTGMPPEILGIIENSNRATIEAADYLMAKYVLVPRLELQRTFMQFLLLPIYDDRLILGYESPVQEDREYQLSVMKENPAAFKVADWKRQAGIETDESDEVYLHPFNLKVVASLEPTPAPAEIAARAARMPSERSTEGECVNALGCTCGKTHAVPRSPDPYAKAISAVDIVSGLLESGSMKQIIPPGFSKQVGGPETTRLALNLSGQMQKELIEAWEALANQIDYRAMMDAFARGDLNAAMQVLNEADLAAELEIARQTLREAVVIVGEASAEELGAFLGESIAFDLTNPESVAFLSEFGGEMVTDVSDETYAALKRLLTQAYDEGMTSKEVAKLIEEHVGLTERDIKQRARLIAAMEEEGLSAAEIAAWDEKWTKAKIKYRAQVIADNELVDAGNQGQRRLWDQAQKDGLIPKDTKKQWIVTPDEKLCQLCGPMSSPQPGISVVGINEAYQTPAGAVFIPSDIHVRCRCSERILV
jgi:hypothetical protein